MVGQRLQTDELPYNILLKENKKDVTSDSDEYQEPKRMQVSHVI